MNVLQTEQQFTPEQAALPERLYYAEARESYWSFRRLVHSDLIQGWWQVHAAVHIQQFIEDMEAGKRPKLVLQAPPQHGKSQQIRDLVAYVAGRRPDWKTIFTSHSDELGMDSNLAIQRTMTSDTYKRIWHGTKLPEMGLRDYTRAREGRRPREHGGRSLLGEFDGKRMVATTRAAAPRVS